MNRSFLLGLALALTTSATALADVVTLEAAVASALETSPTLVGRAARLRATETRIRSIRAQVLPVIGADLGMMGSPGLRLRQITAADGTRTTVSGPQSAGDLRPYFRETLNLHVDSTLYDFGRTAARIDAAEADVAAESTEGEAARESLVRSVRTAYLAWLATHAQRRIVDQALETSLARAGRVQAAFEAGARAGADREVVAIEITRMRLELSRVHASEDDARLQVAALMGAPLPDDAEPDPSWLVADEISTEAPTSRALDALELRRASIGASLRALRRAHAPILVGSANVAVTHQDQLTFPSYSFTLGLTIPIWDARIGPHVRREAEAQDDALEAAADELRAQLASEAARARVAYDRAVEQVALAEEMVRLAQAAAAGTEERYLTAGGSLDTVLMARQREFDANRELVAARLARAVAVLRTRPPL